MDGWSLEQAERYIQSRERLGMRFGLERMHVLLEQLGNPQRSFRSIHIVGTNGKSSTTRMLAALLQQRGLKVGAYLSPHLTSFLERIMIGGAEIDRVSFAGVVEQTAAAVEAVESELPEGDRVTQFEFLAAAAFVALAQHGVEVGVIEAGLGGRYDATNVIPSTVQVLTNVSLEHTELLGSDVVQIAREKLAVVQPGGTLIVGEVSETVADEARACADRVGSRLVQAESAGPSLPHLEGTFQRNNFALACAAAEAYLGSSLDGQSVETVAERIAVPGRLQVIEGSPLVVVDGAHNPAAAEALASSLGPVIEGRQAVLLASIFADKDVQSVLKELSKVAGKVVCTQSANARTLPAVELAALAREEGFEVKAQPVPALALDCAKRWAGQEGAVVVTGSLAFVGELLRTTLPS